MATILPAKALEHWKSLSLPLVLHSRKRCCWVDCRCHANFSGPNRQQLWRHCIFKYCRHFRVPRSRRHVRECGIRAGAAIIICRSQDAVDFKGYDLWSKTVADPADCAADCLAHHSCTHFTHLGKRCFFKSFGEGRRTLKGAKGGVCTKPPKPSQADLQTASKSTLDKGYDISTTIFGTRMLAR